ncbi:hypothetical protein KUTeg_000050 [Tegillarca granosa]|uniref:Lysine-specific histone demethylase 1B n=1 Tax=Tegillarca granosa TaxID=220873 RepID=A0ABQ9FYT9_TEGGR|nr:hypothetical protein KUTeg_000050 [Tegillarca granosa]
MTILDSNEKTGTSKLILQRLFLVLVVLGQSTRINIILRGGLDVTVVINGKNFIMQRNFMKVEWFSNQVSSKVHFVNTKAITVITSIIGWWMSLLHLEWTDNNITDIAMPVMEKSESGPSSTRASGRAVKRKFDSIDENKFEASFSDKRIRKCERTGCLAKVPICFACATERCAGNGYTSRWYHITSAEHFCNECFEHFYRRSGYETYLAWKGLWSKYSRTEASVRTYMADQVLPHWVQCTLCNKWRQLSREATLMPDFLKKFTCGMNASGVKKPGHNQSDACNYPEDQRIEYTWDSFINQITSFSYMKSSPAWPFLTGYFPDGVGMSPTDTDVFVETKAQEMPKYLDPFAISHDHGKARHVTPDTLDELELNEFPDLSRLPVTYLALRNICVTLWNLNCKEWLTRNRCSPYINCRGIIRVFCVENIDRILWFLTRKGLINFGLLPVPKSLSFIPTLAVKEETSVIIIGAGTAGLSAAKQLTNYGIKVKLLEAKSKIGGRICDDESFGVCVGRGAQVINGSSNNPLTAMCYQADIPLKEICDKCELISDKGEIISKEMDRRMDFHFNAILDIIAEWRKTKDVSQDINLLDKFWEMHQQFLDESQLSFSEFHFSNLEYACGCNLRHLSTLNWDQNEAFPQFCGANVVLPQGFLKLLQKLADNLDIVYNSEVKDLDYSGEIVTVKLTNGQEYKANKILVTVPLAVLKNQCIQFKPDLPDWKMAAINSLGIGLVEKVVLKFGRKFWKSKTNGADMFGHVSHDATVRGQFSVFHDISGRSGSKEVLILSTHISGEYLKLTEDKTDKEITIPDPIKYFVTHWKNDKYAQMAYSYVPVGVEGEIFDDMAHVVEDTVFFGGEATNRQHPQSVTGAYLSGIREAEKIFLSLWVIDRGYNMQDIKYRIRYIIYI